MTSLGRGRGWASAQTEKPVLRRPGTVPVQTFDCTGLINEITRIKEGEDISQFIIDVGGRFSNVESDSIKTTVEKLYSIAISDRKFGTNFVRVFLENNAARQNWDGESLHIKKHVLMCMQTDFDRKEDFMKESPAQCRNAAYMVFVAFKYMRLGDGPLKIFIVAACTYLQLFIETPTIENLELATQQLINIGEEMQRVDKTAFDMLMLSVRKSLIIENHAPLPKALLLFILDLSNCNFSCSSLSKDTRILYTQQFGERAFMFLGNSIEETIEPSEPESTESTSPPVPSNKAVPRAIRGSGATRIQSVQKKTRASPPSSKRIGDKKGWDHDDRFEKDYSY